MLGGKARFQPHHLKESIIEFYTAYSHATNDEEKMVSNQISPQVQFDSSEILTMDNNVCRGSESAFSLKFSRSRSRECPVSSCSSSPASLDSGHSLRSPHPESLRLSPGSPGQVRHARHVRLPFSCICDKLLRVTVTETASPHPHSSHVPYFHSCKIEF